MKQREKKELDTSVQGIIIREMIAHVTSDWSKDQKWRITKKISRACLECTRRLFTNRDKNGTV